MNLALLLPAGLVALAALLLPLLLHLARRAEATPTTFAALRWLSARLRPRRRIRFEEWWLLLLRLLLVACVALLFARPAVTGIGAGEPWVLVAPGLDPAAARAALGQGDANGDDERHWHWLAVGFPPLDAAAPAVAQPTASLLREIDARLAPNTSLTVFLPAVLDGLDGERPILSRPLAWRVLPSQAPAPARAIDADAARAPPIGLRHAPDRLASARHVRAAARALGRGLDAGAPSRPLPASLRQLVWLAAGDVPAPVRTWVERGGVLLLDRDARIAGLSPSLPRWRDAQGRVLAQEAALGRGRVIQLQQALLPAELPQLLEGEFPQQLSALLEPTPAPPARATAAAAQPRSGGVAYAPVPEPIDPWLAFVAAALFLLERWFATTRARIRRT